MDINLNDLPFVIYACFMIHKYYEATKETMDENRVIEAIQHDKDNQQDTQTYFRAFRVSEHCQFILVSPLAT